MTKTINIEHNAGNINIGDSFEYKTESAINELLKNLASRPFKHQTSFRRQPTQTIVKIKHNNLVNKTHVFRQYQEYSETIESAYIDIDSIIPFGKSTILRNLSDLYYAALDELDIDCLTSSPDIAKIKHHSNFILEYVIQKLKNSSFESSNGPSFKEHVEQGINVVVAHAFIECIIFDNPST